MKKQVMVLLVALMLLLCACTATPQKPATDNSTEATAAPAADAPAVQWPSETVSLIVPYGAGGSVDTFGRILANYLQEKTGKTVVVLNADGGTAVSYEQLRTAQPDGNTILIGHLGFANSYFLGNYDYALNDPNNYTVISCLMSQGNNCLVVNANSEWNTLNDFVAYAKEHPGELIAGITSNATSELVFAALCQQAGIDIQLLDGGIETEKLVSMEGGFIDITLISAGTAKNYAEAGKVKVLAAVSDEKDPSWPTTVEQGFDIAWDNGLFVYGPAGMDPALVEAINAVFATIQDDADTIAIIENAGGIPGYNNATEANERLQKRWTEISETMIALGKNAH